MLSFRQYLTELFDAPAPWTWTTPYKLARFAVGGRTYLVYIERGELSFEIEGTADDKRHDILGTGNQYIVFSTVLDVLRAYVAYDKYQMVKFSAKEDSRKKLYTKFAALLKSSFPFHRVAVTDDRMGWQVNLRPPTNTSPAYDAWASNLKH